MSRRLSYATALAVVLLSAPLAAQGVPQHSSLPALPPITVAAQLGATTVAIPRTPTPVATWSNAATSSSANAPTIVPVRLPALGDDGSRSPAMMIVGGATLLVGAVVGGKAGTMIMIGGGFIGIVGLWNYLK